MRLRSKRKTPTDELRDAAITALVNALDDKPAAKPGTKGVRSLAAGAVLYALGRAAFKGQRLLREQRSSGTDDDQAENLADDESRSTTPSPFPQRKPGPRAARRKGAQPTLKLQNQRRARTWASNN